MIFLKLTVSIWFLMTVSIELKIVLIVTLDAKPQFLSINDIRVKYCIVASEFN